MVKILIRRAKLCDVKQMKDINTRNLAENYEIEYWNAVFSKHKEHCFVAIYTNLVIGYVLGNADTIVSFVVDEKFRGYGVGREIMHHCLNSYARDVCLHVRKSNDVARRLYYSLDFVDDHLVENYYTSPTEDAYEMVRRYDPRRPKYPERIKMNVELKVRDDGDWLVRTAQAPTSLLPASPPASLPVSLSASLPVPEPAGAPAESTCRTPSSDR